MAELKLNNWYPLEKWAFLSNALDTAIEWIQAHDIKPRSNWMPKQAMLEYLKSARQTSESLWQDLDKSPKESK